ncbi:MAG TPA: Lpg1974 family pore-forming outer membrane protein [Gammaproteobacteria bacterium]|nr:Lpg1974 family pore-forming outer membrane protein [Gammaproteobacteria bacterium]
MRSLFYLFIALMLCMTEAKAVEFSAGPIYWHTTESVDWAANNDMQTPKQNITYETAHFNTDPGIRLALAKEGDWTMKWIFTNFNTRTNGSLTGNITSAFLGARLANLTSTYNAEQMSYSIDYNMFNWYIGQNFILTEMLTLQPVVGLTGGWINQNIKTHLQGTSVSVNETVRNDFSGVGPMFGVNASWKLYQHQQQTLNLLTSFSTALLAGHWVLSDITEYVSPSPSAPIDLGLGNRNMSALTVGASVGAAYQYQAFKAVLSYEINDWFDQGQMFDNATGAHNNNLIFQGAVLSLAWVV